MIVRENSEGEYSGVARARAQGTAGGSRDGRLHVHAHRRDEDHPLRVRDRGSRPRKLLTSSPSRTRNAMVVMWDEIAAEVARDYPDVTWDKMLVDAMTMRMVLRPQTIDTIVAYELHCRHSVRSCRSARRIAWHRANANLNPERKTPSMFEPFMAPPSTSPARASRTGRYVLDRRNDARTSRRKGRRRSLMRAVERVMRIPGCTRPISAEPRRPVR